MTKFSKTRKDVLQRRMSVREKELAAERLGSFLTCKRCCELAMVSRNTFLHAIRMDYVYAVKVGNNYIVEEDSFLTYILRMFGEPFLAKVLEKMYAVDIALKQ